MNLLFPSQPFSPTSDEGEYSSLLPPKDLFCELASRIQSRFFTMDVALCQNGTWIILELGDGQVAGIPQRLNASHFYQALAAAGERSTRRSFLNCQSRLSTRKIQKYH